MDVVLKDPSRRKLLIGFVVVAVVVVNHRRIFCKLASLFRREAQWLKYMKKLKKEMKPAFGFQRETKDVAQYGLTSPKEAWTHENPRPLAFEEGAIDSINVWGADNAGNVVMLRMARRLNRCAEVWIYLKLKNGDEFQAPIQPDLKVYDTDDESFSAKGLFFEVLEPLRRMRIGFHGELRKGVRNTWSDMEGQAVRVKFNFIWHPMYNYSAYPSDFNPVLMASTLSKHKFTKDAAKLWTLSPTEWHEQWGQLCGPVTIGNDTSVFMLTGTKTREYGIMDWRAVDRALVIRVFDSIATGVTLYGNADEDGMTQIYHGQVAPPSTMGLYSVSECTMDKPARLFDINNDTNKKININIVADARKYALRLSTRGPGFNFYAGDTWAVRGCCRLVKAQINDRPGFALVEVYDDYADGTPIDRLESVSRLVEPDIETTEKLTVFFEEVDCRSSMIVGGKGASLALMTTLLTDDSEFKIPKGLCLTKKFLERHIEDHPPFAELIAAIENEAWRGCPKKLKELCDSVDTLVVVWQMSEDLQDRLRSALKIFGKDLNGVRLAVRSSAVGEDSAETSAAGQNETFLGVNGYDKILEAILRCWGSQFSHRSVEYKRQRGQLLNAGMGIVIQEMVPAEMAGVIFTRDPTTGNAAQMTLSSNYGLGESVVSSKSDPDTLTINRTWRDQLSVVEKVVGWKEVSIVMHEDSNIVEVKNSEQDTQKFSISDYMALRIGKVAVQLEWAFGSPRDVEWAIVDDQIYILQARPMTTDTVLTEFEVHHEFDTTFRTNNEQLSTGNVAEVMPGALSPLSLTSNIRAYCINFQRMFMAEIDFRFDPTIFYGSMFYTSHMFFDLIQQQAPFLNNKKRDMLSKATDIGVYGKVVDETEPMRMAKERYEDRCSDLGLMLLCLTLKSVFRSKALVSAMEKKYGKYPDIIAEAQTPQEAYAKINAKMLDVCEAFTSHLTVTVGSMLWNSLALVAIAKGAQDFNADHYADFAILIGDAIGTESGGVPLGMQEVATAIRQDFHAGDFATMPLKDALELLQNGVTNSSKKFLKFTERHGHRGVNEFDLISVSWGSDNLALVKALRRMVGSSASLKARAEASTSWKTIGKLKTSIGFFRKCYLCWVLNRSKNAVICRERAKSALVNLFNSFRLAFHRLATMLVEQGYLPEKDLLYFMTLEEIGQLIDTRSARIIMRAQRRKRQYSYMYSLEYPELVVGVPQPANEETDLEIPEGTTQITGLPVSHGRVIGTAKVITFDKVSTLEANDILITHATDIGWSPYFPLLAGVVTEIGGLVSHGAVVAREYGLPCIISASNATKVFKTGDRVLLDATTGIIAKVPNEE